MKPQRLQRTRARGYDMQAESRALNGLECVSVCRPGRFGNPYRVDRFGRDVALTLFRNTVHGVWNRSPVRGADDALLAEAHKAHHDFLRRLGGDPIEIARRVLRGRNLACFCPLTVACHADEWLKIAND